MKTRIVIENHSFPESILVPRKSNDILCNFHEMQISYRRWGNQRGSQSRRHRAMHHEYVASPHAKEGSEKAKRNRTILGRNEGTVRRNVAISLRDWTKHLPPGSPKQRHAPVPLEKEELRVFFIPPASCSPALPSPFHLLLFAQLLSVYLFQLALTKLVFSRFFPLFSCFVSEIRSSSFSPVQLSVPSFSSVRTSRLFLSSFAFLLLSCVALYVPFSSLCTLFARARHNAISVDICSVRRKSLNACWTHRV